MQTKKSLQRQTLPIIPASPKPLGIWNSLLLFLFGLSIGCYVGLTSTSNSGLLTSSYEVNHD